MSQQEPPKIEFPCADYPIKVMGIASQDYYDAVLAIIERHAAICLRAHGQPRHAAVSPAHHDPAAFSQLLDQFAIRRTNKRFWSFSDQFHQSYRNMSPVTYGLLDFNRLENR